MLLSDKILYLPRTAPRTQTLLKKIGIETLWDLINYFPRRYEDYSAILPIAQLRFGQLATIRGSLSDVRQEMSRGGARLQKATLSDQTGAIDLTWFNQPYLIHTLGQAQMLSVAGQLQQFGLERGFQTRDYQIITSLSDHNIHTGRLVPVYPEVRGLSSRTIREKIFFVCDMLQRQEERAMTEFIPVDILRQFDLIDIWEAHRQIHFPDSTVHQQRARRRLSFDEVFIIALSAKLLKRDHGQTPVKKKLVMTGELKKELADFIARLPFQLTAAQLRCIDEIIADMSRNIPMNRLLQGDVGSGKTVVAAAAALVTAKNGQKTLLMAPTEILARQHYNSLRKLYEPGAGKQNMNLSLLTASNRENSDQLNQANIIVGTHALIATKTRSFDNVGLIIVDEQHKFGVTQRQTLEKRAAVPHVLSMSATPIPRTVALTLYGELDISVLDSLPPGRVKTITYLVPQKKRNDAYAWIAARIKKEGIQVFIVCPFIDVSKSESLSTLKAAREEFKRLREGPLSDAKMALLHGRLKPNQKGEIMEQFAGGQLDVLVSTPIVEVGIDVPNAAIIAIETPERFGLSQLHQLRGRVGRGQRRATCLLLLSEGGMEVKERLSIFAKTFDGFKLAEHDLRLRGLGQIYGAKQHGLTDLKIADLTDTKLIEKTVKAADFFIEKYGNIHDFDELESRISTHRRAQTARN